jgi:hypothetical protein
VKKTPPDIHCPFDLGAELEKLRRVHAAGSGEATVFHCARVMEGISRALVGPHVYAEKPAYGLLQELASQGVMTHAQLAFAHTLRDMGNDVRHLRRGIGPDDVEVSLALLWRLLIWAAEAIRLQGHVKWAADASQVGGMVPHGVVRAMAVALDYPAFIQPDLDALSRLWQEGQAHGLLATPVFCALYAETLRACDRWDALPQVVEAGLRAFPRERALLKLDALLARHRQQLDIACRSLEALNREARDDREIEGLLAGTYRELAFAKPNGRKELQKAREIYMRGWERSLGEGRPDGYCGINAAALVLLSGEPVVSRSTAGEVLRCARSQGGVSRAFAGYWDRATAAEAWLLVGQLRRARQEYAHAMGMYRHLGACIAATKAQIGRILPRLGLTLSAEAFLAEPPYVPADHRLHIGVAGHRHLDVSPPLLANIRTALEAIRTQAGGACAFYVLSSLAEGADRLAVRLAIDQEAAGLCCVLPMEIDEYEADFPESTAEFHEFLNHAVEIVFPADAGMTRPGVYFAASRQIVDRADVLLVLWDGREAAGYGGTADVVAYARREGKPTIIVGARRTVAAPEATLRPSEETAPAADAGPGSNPRGHGLSAGTLTRLAAHQHAVWARSRLEEGRRDGLTPDEVLDRFTRLVPFEELTSEAQGDNMRSVEAMLRVIVSQGYVISDPATAQPADTETAT